MTPIEALEYATRWATKDARYCCIYTDECVMNERSCFFSEVIERKTECPSYEVFSTIKKAILEKQDGSD